MTDITGKTCLVTGGAGGLGKAIATRFLAANANVVICDINEARLQETETELSASSSVGKVKAIKADITSAAAVQTLFDEIITTFGKVDILVNNAGIMDRFDPVGDLDENLWDKVIAVNLTAPFLLSKLAVQNMLAQEKVEGNIVNIVSLAGRGGGVAGAAYTASKHGLVGLTKNTAVSYGSKGIRCNALMMGGMDTNITEAFMAGINLEAKDRIVELMQAMRVPMCPLGEVAEVVFSMTCGPGARLMNGNCVPVDNGFSAVA